MALSVGVTGLLLHEAAVPPGIPDTESATGDVNPSVAVTPTVYVTDSPWVMTCDGGCTPISKSCSVGGGSANTIRSKNSEWVSVPDVPVMINPKVPVGPAVEGVMTNDVLSVGITGLAPQLNAALAGRGPTSSATD